MTRDERYNGWTNRETWLVALWIDNEQGSYEYSRELARRYADRPTPVQLLANALHEWVKEGAPELNGLWSDLQTRALRRVNWYEIAENYIEEVEEATNAD